MNFLIIDDERFVVDAILHNLRERGFAGIATNDMDEAARLIRAGDIGFVIMDIDRHEKNGFDACRTVRMMTKAPLLIVSRRAEVDDRIQGLRCCADDYLAKPFDMDELIARVDSVLRRTGQNDTCSAEMLQAGEMKLDPNSHEVFVRGERIQMPFQEFKVLHFLMSNPDQVFSRDSLIANVWPDQGVSNATVDVHIHRIRSRIEVDQANPRHLITVIRAGFKFVP